mgnify:CR=1 FL=1|jgi:hypothetical protein
MEPTQANIVMSLRIDNMEKKLDEIDKKLDMITVKLLDPDDGFVTRVNKNTSFRNNMNELLPYYEETIEEFKHLKRWKDNVSRALWTIFVALVGVFVKLIFFA